MNATQSIPTALNNAMAACKRSFEAELAAKDAGRKFDNLGALAAIVGPLDSELSATLIELCDGDAAATAEASKLAVARAADPDLDARVAARRAARKANR